MTDEMKKQDPKHDEWSRELFDAKNEVKDELKLDRGTSESLLYLGVDKAVVEEPHPSKAGETVNKERRVLYFRKFNSDLVYINDADLLAKYKDNLAIGHYMNLTYRGHKVEDGRKVNVYHRQPLPEGSYGAYDAKIKAGWDAKK